MRRLRPPRPALPGLEAFASWRQNRRGDAVAGLAVAAYLVPQCMAYAGLAGLEPVSGLWAALAALAVYALLGTSSRLSVGPESASALLVGVGGRDDRSGRWTRVEHARCAALALGVAGVVAVVAWVTGWGSSPTCCRSPVLVGYMAGVAVAMIVSQLPNLTGIASDAARHRGRVVGRRRADLDDLRLAPLLVGAGVLVALVVLERVPRRPRTAVRRARGDRRHRAPRPRGHGVADGRRGPPRSPAAGAPRASRASSGPWCSPRLPASASSYSPTTSSPPAPSRHATANASTPTRSCSRSAGANAAAGVAGGFPVSSSASRTALADSAGGADAADEPGGRCLRRRASCCVGGCRCWSRSRSPPWVGWWSMPASASSTSARCGGSPRSGAARR